ncbi:MAG: hypothetical protein V4544_07305 [Pseudomonadota bacterium]
MAHMSSIKFDALIHLDHTTAVMPLDLTESWAKGELPTTYPLAYKE